MRKALPAAEHLARTVLAFESGDGVATPALADAAGRACDKLRAHLAKIMGQDGFLLLLTRALTFARADFPWLQGVQPGADGSLSGLNAAATGLEAAAAAAGFVAVLSHLLSLLITFIGESLTLRLVQAVWPDARLDGNAPGDAPGMEEAI